MAHIIAVNPSGRTVNITGLTVGNHDFFSLVAAQPESKREQTVLHIIAVGSAAMMRVQTTVDVDFVEKRFGTLAANFERGLGAFEKQVAETIAKRFSPTESGSYTRGVTDLVASARKDFQGWTTDFEKAAKNLLDPEKKTSAVGRFEGLVEEATAQFEHMFDPEAKDSYGWRLKEHLSSLFGGNGRPGALDASLQQAIQPVLKELREVKEKVEARKAAEQVIASSSLKGRPFEELVHARLSQLAQPFADDVQSVGSGNGGSRAGDFVVTVNGTAKRLVVEARDRKQMSLPAIKADLEREMKEREADFALYVSSGPEMLPQHVGDFQIWEDKLITTLDNIHIGYRLARLMLLNNSQRGEVDSVALRPMLAKARDAAGALRKVKSKATQAANLAGEIRDDAGEIQDNLLSLLQEAERLLAGKTS